MSEKFEIGVQVVYTNRNGKRLATVTKITKTGQFEISVLTGTKFNPDGSERGNDAWNSGRCYIATSEMVKQMKDEKDLRVLINSLSNVFSHHDGIKKLGMDKLKRIQAIIDEN